MRLLFFSSIGLLLLTGCFMSVSAKNLDEELNTQNRKWIEALNNHGSFHGLYTPNLLFFPGKEVFQTGQDSAAAYYKNLNKANITFTEANVTYRVRQNNTIYELGLLGTTTEERYVYLTVWQHFEDEWIRELQAITELTVENQEYTAIDRAREMWVNLSNAHSTQDLVNKMYTTDCIYYNQGKVYRGLSEVTRVYEYMNYPTYSIQLTKLAGLMVQPDLAYEIGHYESNGFAGSYIIIWSKQPDGEWKVMLDTNW